MRGAPGSVMSDRATCAALALGLALLGSGVLAAPAVAQQQEAVAPPRSEAPARPYLQGHEPDFELFLGRPPSRGSLTDQQDVREVAGYQHVDLRRWQAALADANFVYPRFDEAFGQPVDRTSSLALVRLLNRAMADVEATTYAAKVHYGRPRPYQRHRLGRVCNQEEPPAPDAHPSTGTSYPSGHAAVGWAVAMILARLAPERAEALFARATEYAESRLVCGMHFPSDVVAGKLVATAVVTTLDSDPAFQADLDLARRELARRKSNG